MPDVIDSSAHRARFTRRALRIGCAAPVLAFLAATSTAAPPGDGIVLTHVAAIVSQPAFYAGKTVRVQGAIAATGERWRIEGLGGAGLILVAPGIPLAAGRMDVVGQILDIGALSRDDPRFAVPSIRALLPSGGENWPERGELVVCVAQSVSAAQNFPAPSLTAIVLDPARYLESSVTIVGQFHGRNLLGELPGGVGFDKSEFVLSNLGAAIWVLGLRPRGQGFNLDPASRSDMSKWLEVQGTVRHRGGVLWIDGRQIALTRQPPPAPPPVLTPPAPTAPPEVLFSLPSENETDVSSSTAVRIQVSRPLDPATFEGHIRIAYEPPPRGGGEGAPAEAPGFVAAWDPVNRVVEIRFLQPLLRFRTVRVELAGGILGADKAPLTPWSLRFSVGGRLRDDSERRHDQLLPLVGPG